MKIQKLYMNITAHPWCGGHSASIKCLWGVGGKGRGLSFTYIHLDQVIVKFLSCIKKKKLYMDRYGRRLKQIIQEL